MASSIIAIVNQKGGVGKTTTAINLSSYLSEKGYRTLLIDFDPQANATSGIGIKQEAIKHTVYALLVDPEKLKDVLYPTPFDGLHIIPSGRDLAGAEIELVSCDSRETILKHRVAPLKKYYDFIIIDCPPSLGLLTVNALVAADRAIIPAQCEYFALEGLAGLMDTVRLIQEGYNANLKIAGILLTMFDKRTALNRQVVQNARDFFKELIFDTIIPRNVRLTEAPSHGLPIALYNPYSKGAGAYYQLSQEVIERVRY